MKIQKNISLAPFTSLNCGGSAEFFVECATESELREALTAHQNLPITVLGYGTNSLITDKGIPGLTILLRNNEIYFEDTLLIAEAGVWWDDLIEATAAKKLWGLELTNGIPSSVGGAVMGNIAAYGQQISDTLVWIDVLNSKTLETKRVIVSEILFAYRASSLQEQPEIIITKAAFRLSKTITMPLKYASALNIANELKLNPDNLKERAQIILEARKRAGSLYQFGISDQPRTAGSFFKNPTVTQPQLEEIIKHEERAVSSKFILDQNKIHGGNTQRVSAAHVLLAAGFFRGQSWGNVRLHPEHILKIENTGSATAQEIYDVAQLIIATVKTRLGIDLTPEVKFLGAFENARIK